MLGSWLTAPEYRRMRNWLRLLAGLVLVLGLAGAWFGMTRIDPTASRSQLLGNLLALMTGNWQPETGVRLPWTLQVAYMIVPLATTGFVVLLAADFWRVARSLRRNHIVLVGSGHAAGTIEARLRHPKGEPGPRQGVAVAKLGDADALRDSGIRRARSVVVCGNDDFDGATNVATTRTAVRRAKRNDFTAHLLVGDSGLALALRARRLAKVEPAGRRPRTGEPTDPDRRIRVFTVDELAVRHHVRQVPPSDQPRPHVLVVGSSAFGRALIVEYARRWQHAAGGRPLVTLVADDAKQAIDEIVGRWPFVARACELQAREEPVEQAMLSIIVPPYRSYFCADADEPTLRTALTAAVRWQPAPASIVVRLTRLATEAGAFADIFDTLGGAVVPLSVYDAAAQEILGTEEPLLYFAQTIHQSYLDDAVRRGETLGSKPALRRWDELSEEYQRSNIEQAESFPRTLAAINCSVAPRSRLANPFYLRPGEVDLLARREHEHWLEERTTSGWLPGPRDDKRRRNPLLVPWEDLSESDRSRNRDIVRSRPLLFDRALERDGLQIVRLAATAATATATGPGGADWLSPELVELLAQRIHENYLAHRLAEGEQLGARPSLQAWETLPEDYKESNRAQARDIVNKLVLVEAEVSTTPPAQPFAFTTEEAEMLARYEHDRWLSQRLESGWGYDAARDEADKKNDLMVPWLYLPDSKKELDREAVLAIPALLASIGRYVRRRGES